jgi:hypothetical protein
MTNNLGSEPPPAAPHKKRGFWKKPFTWIFGLIGIVASTSTVVALVQGWFDPAPSAEELAAESAEKLEKIEKKLEAKQEDKHLVNQVSRRVTELTDQFGRINKKMKDIRRLAKALASKGSKILTPEQERLAEASRKKETEELLALIEQTKKMASDFVASVEEDATLGQVTSKESQTARTKARALDQARKIRSGILPQLKSLREKYADQ